MPEDDRLDFSAAAERLLGLSGLLEDWRCQRESGMVYWIDATRSRRGRPRMKLAAAPLDVGPALREHLFDKVSTVIMTSATLAVGRGDSFDFFKSRVGLTGAVTRRWGSPFDYPRQAELVLVDGMPDPTADKPGYEKAAVDMIRRYVARTDGHAFVLFTSYEMMNRAATALTPWLAAHGLELYCQGADVPRSQMVARFLANPRAVLLGTDSFWQGVDVPGDALQNVIITKLPFSGAGPTAAGSAARGDSRRRRQSLQRLSIARSRAQAEARLRPVDPQQARSWTGGDSGSARTHQAVWPAVSRFAARLPAHYRLVRRRPGAARLG